MLFRSGPGTLGELAALFGGQRPFEVRFDTCRRFPDTLYLAPTPERPFRALTDAVGGRWPEAPPYGGRFTDVVPHLTVAHGQPAEVSDEVAAALAPRLPVTAHVSSVGLFVSDGDRRHRHAGFPLRA